jgi:hypothetical protein
MLAAVAVAAAAVDLYRPLHRDLRRFDPDAVARLETAMWRDYYDRRPAALFADLAESLHMQFGFPLLRSYAGAWHAAAAAFIFKDGHDRDDYRRALPALRAYFESIRRTGDIDFGVDAAATLELEWWIVHREAAGRGPDELALACARAAAALYRIPVDAALEHGRWRAVAMILRDVRADAGGVSEDDWTQIESDLRRSYHALAVALAALR